MNKNKVQQNDSEKIHYDYGEVDFIKVFYTLWEFKWWVIGVTFIFSVASTIYAFTTPNKYKATVIVQPNDSGSKGGLRSVAHQLGGLASLAGINLGAGDAADTKIALEVIKSWGFLEDFIDSRDLAVPAYAAKGWDPSKDALLIDSDLYDIALNKWVESDNGETEKPSSWKLYKKFIKGLDVNIHQESGLVSISITHFSPKIAKQWTELLLKEINLYMKEKALSEAEQNINYLEEQISNTTIAEIRMVFSELLQEQHKTKMLANASDQYIFKTVSSPKVPEVSSSPNRKIIVTLGTILGLFFSVFIILLISILKSMRAVD